MRRRHPVDHRVHGARPRPIHRIPHLAIAVAHRACHTRREEHQRVNIPRVQRHVDDGPVIHDLAQSRRFRLQPCHIRRNHDRFGQFAHRELEVHARHLLNLEQDAFTHQALEPFGHRLRAIIAPRQLRGRIVAPGVRRNRCAKACVRVDYQNLGARNRRPGSVGHKPGDRPGECLRDGRSCQDDDCCKNSQPHGTAPLSGSQAIRAGCLRQHFCNTIVINFC